MRFIVFEIGGKSAKYEDDRWLLYNDISYLFYVLCASLGLDVQLWSWSLETIRHHQGVTRRCRLSWLTNSALIYEPKCGGRGGELRGLSQWVQLCKWSPNKLWRPNSIVYPILAVQGCILPCLVWGPKSLTVWSRKISKKFLFYQVGLLIIHESCQGCKTYIFNLWIS
jgi:hypothetical protein